MSSDIKLGDVVQLKSGGPKMTIQKLGTFTTVGGPGAVCVWFDGSKEQKQVFALVTLQKI
ncbi:YodC family protein [Bradyrhizobium vignae]|uniref:DUF2158 domain-containing protein n=1 Tax=Bradyrhizobium vignae TaxID=1549949 RepID=A0ABS4A7Z9_9BRAD|nr:DUF2158 domain-containing protein [Bradyrhizobium vignae]MBP0116386.1 DUF2158 domain-containing protein [Bradyrhizobium vignae]